MRFGGVWGKFEGTFGRGDCLFVLLLAVKGFSKNFMRQTVTGFALNHAPGVLSRLFVTARCIANESQPYERSRVFRVYLEHASERFLSLLKPARLQVRLLFRVASPYFLRALGREQPPGEKPRLEALIPELVVTEMGKVDLDL